MTTGEPGGRRKTAGFPARFYLIALVLAVAVPAVLVTGYLLMRYAEAERAHVEEMVREEAHLLATSLDRRFAGMIKAVQVMVLTQDFDREGLRDFYTRASRARGILGRNIVLRTVDGQQLVNPRLPWGQDLPRIVLGADKIAAQTGQPQVSGVFESPLDGAKIVSITVPIMRDGKPLYLLNLSQNLSYFEELLAEARLPARHGAVIVDSAGAIVAQTGDAGPGFRKTGEGDEGATLAFYPDENQVLMGWATSDITGWRTVAMVPHEVIDAPRRRALTMIAVVGASLILLGLALAWGLGTRVSRSLRLLTRAGAALGARRPVPPVETPLAEVNEVARALRDSEVRLQENEARLERALVAARMYSFEWRQTDDSVTRSASSAVVLGEIAPDMKHGRRSELRERIHPLDQASFARAIDGLSPDAPRYFVEYRYVRPSGEIVWLQTSGVAEFGPSHDGVRITGFTRDVTSRKEAEIRQSLLVRELHHRVKNNLATVLALANLSSRNAVSVEDYKNKLRARIQSMARSHSLLNENSFRSAFLPTLLQDELEPYAQGDPDRISVGGPDVDLPPEAALAFGMAIHELATNASKYGSLSSERGRLDVRWEVLDDTFSRRPDRKLRLTWRESDGPPVVRPARKGFGSRLLESVIGDQLKGRVDLRYEPNGLVAEIEASLDGASARETSATASA